MGPGALRPFGDDFIIYWSGAFLALTGRAGDIYNFDAFHAFEQSVTGAPIQFYRYSYPPVLPLISARRPSSSPCALRLRRAAPAPLPASQRAYQRSRFRLDCGWNSASASPSLRVHEIDESRIERVAICPLSRHLCLGQG